MSTKPRSSSHQRVVKILGRTWLLAGIGTGLFWLLHGGEAGQSAAPQVTQTTFVSHTSDDPTPSPGVTTRNIEDIRVGDRVIARNPQVSEHERAGWREPDEDTWGFFKLEMPLPQHGVLEIEIIRPLEWEPWNSARAGDVIPLDLPEMGAVGSARVVETATRPPIQQSPDGQVVTATFRHPPSTDVLNVVFEGSDTPVGVTSNHLFWSVEANDYLQIGEMSVGDRLLTQQGEVRRIVSLQPRARPQRVYNLEVYGEHVYFVGACGILAHNTYTNPRMRKAVNELDSSGYRWYRNPFTNQMKRTRLKLAPDHVFAAKHIEDLDGFNDLSRPQQLQLLTDMKNIEPLPIRLNSSKGANTGLQWKTALGKKIDPGYSRWLRAKELRMEKYFKAKIAEMLKSS